MQLATIAQIHPNPTRELGHIFGAYPEVKKVFATRDGNCVSVWTVVETFDRSFRNQLYERERDIFAAYPSVKFDFHVIPDSDDVDISEAELIYVR
jgi:hypothetical protein